MERVRIKAECSSRRHDAAELAQRGLGLSRSDLGCKVAFDFHVSLKVPDFPEVVSRAGSGPLTYSCGGQMEICLGGTSSKHFAARHQVDENLRGCSCDRVMPCLGLLVQEKRLRLYCTARDPIVAIRWVPSRMVPADLGFRLFNRRMLDGCDWSGSRLKMPLGHWNDVVRASHLRIFRCMWSLWARHLVPRVTRPNKDGSTSPLEDTRTCPVEYDAHGIRCKGWESAREFLLEGPASAPHQHKKTSENGRDPRTFAA